MNTLDLSFLCITYSQYLFTLCLAALCPLCAGFPLAAGTGVTLCWCVGFSLRGPLLLWSTGFGLCGLQQLWHMAQEFRLPGSRAQAQWLWHRSLVVPWHLGSFRIRDWTRVFCTSREILYRWATWEASLCLIFYIYVYEFFPIYHMLCSQWCCFVCFLSFWWDSHLNHNSMFSPLAEVCSFMSQL